jgi:hypothetical protein
MSTSPQSELSLDAFYVFRQGLTDAVRRDLIGPYEELERISDPPLTKYIAGILYPQSDRVLSEEILAEDDNDVLDEDEDFAPDPAVALANVRFPASAGLTFSVDTSAVHQIQVQASAARYELITEPNRSEDRKSESSWRRVPLELPLQTISVDHPQSHISLPMASGLELFCRVREPHDDTAAVTAVLVNKNAVSSDDPMGTRDLRSFLQVALRVTAPKAKTPAFIERRTIDLAVEDADLETYSLLYRNARSFAAGHGCAAEWTLSADGKRAEEIRTSFLPCHELLAAVSNSEFPQGLLELRLLAGEDWKKSHASLKAICDLYQEWIDSQKTQVSTLPEGLRETAHKHLANCQEASDRMSAGVGVLDKNKEARRAFQLANKAMLQQRSRAEWIRQNTQVPEPTESGSFSWRPFQIGFILLCIPGLVAPKSPDREIADLLWFPTGGGKTEAYLGLIAFTSFFRRLRSGGKHGGVTALMRYTLRLLTIQQFERAALLIATCERIRQQDVAHLGREPLSIGLWVGQGATPNTRDDCRKALEKLKQMRDVESLTTGNPMQLPRCIWCGADLDRDNYWQRSSDNALVVSCRQKDCDFAKGLPVHLVDEDIYDFRPTLIIGTVDKFAALPWKPETATLFNLDQDQPAPELIIQDELHLISGPLGTLMGLYETAIDTVCSSKGIKPKIVASTATIRRADAQTKALFNRKFRQFPPPALDADDSFFARVAPRVQKGTRLYCGIMAPGASHSTLMIRVYAALLQAAKDLSGHPTVRDTYWTLLGYFNSLRVLGGAKLQVQDDVNDRLIYVAGLLGRVPRELKEPIELTSRVPSAEIPLNLKAIERHYPDSSAEDVLLATNMISVGVDVERLGLMVIMGQPQATSEYIQSSSRVGRKYPGLVFTLYNAGRSRDRSHYENFMTYHSALYRQVESTSVTPFSPRARDRGLHAVLVGLARLLTAKYRTNKSASEISELSKDLTPVENAILERVANITAEQEIVEQVRNDLDSLVRRWEQAALEEPSLLFSKWKHPRESLLVEAYEQHPDAEARFKTLRSLRDVDKNSDLYLTKVTR